MADVFEKVSQMQKLTAYTSSIKQLHKGQLSKFNILKPKTQQLRYMLDIVDHNDPAVLGQNTCAVFIVPQGQETMELYRCEEGIKQLHEQVGTSRLIIAKLVIGQEFKSMDVIK